MVYILRSMEYLGIEYNFNGARSSAIPQYFMEQSNLIEYMQLQIY